MKNMPKGKRTFSSCARTALVLLLLSAMLMPCFLVPVSADNPGKGISLSDADTAPDFSSLTDEELFALAQEAEKNSRGYTTVSNQKVALELPFAEEHLAEPLRMQVKFSKNGAIFIMPRPKTGGGVLGTLKAGTAVTVIAEYKNFYFFITDDGRMGWNGKNYFEEISARDSGRDRPRIAKTETEDLNFFSKEDLLVLAQTAEKNNRDYSTVSNKNVELEVPYPDDYLPEPMLMEVKFSSNGAILIMPKPKTGNGNLGTITAGTKVVVIAEYKSFYFFIAEDGRMGWCTKSFLTD